ncbi:dihydrofolate reductase family protein [Micromonospora sp. NBC_00389]|uniref:dihydrofolate reductase family protein n=1 Tax=Micromonospora sp. NBC_00389 TaxID=2903586 RepID=UPI002E1D5EA9
MRKMIAGLFMSLDGVADAPDGWQFPYLDADVMASITSSMAQTDALLFGRRTYDEFATRWPDQRGNRSAEFFNDTQKYVVTSKAAGLDWGPVTQLNGDLAAELATLKAKPGKDILIQGSTALVRSLLRDGLLDELSLLIIPILAGVGLRLFDDNARVELILTESTVFDNGVVKVTYRPASAPHGER